MSREISAAKRLYDESKNHLIERVGANIDNCGSLVRQVIRGSKCNEITGQCLSAMVNLEHSIDNTGANLKKLMDTYQHLNHILGKRLEEYEQSHNTGVNK